MDSEKEKPMAKKAIVPQGDSYERWLEEKSAWVDNSLTQRQKKQLEEAFLNMATERQACFIAGIKKKDLERYFERNPDFHSRCKGLSQMVKYKAKMNIAKKVLEGDTDTSKWLSDRLMKDEGFTTRQEVSGKGGAPLINIVSFDNSNPPQEPIDGEICQDQK